MKKQFTRKESLHSGRSRYNGKRKRGNANRIFVNTRGACLQAERRRIAVNPYNPN